jgi:shikimate kinase
MHHSSAPAETGMGNEEARQAARNIYLVGPMGSGKTTLGRRVAERLGLEFVDCDQEIERRTGASVNLIFDIEGEAGFRERETEVLREIASRSGLLVATGGGAVTRPANRELLRSTGFIVWLRTSVDHQIDRLGRDQSRPLLQTPDRRQRLQRLAEQRNPLYQEVADLVFDSSNRNVKRVAEHLLQAITQHWQATQVHRGHGTD